jgi:hypothetical protein
MRAANQEHVRELGPIVSELALAAGLACETPNRLAQLDQEELRQWHTGSPARPKRTSIFVQACGASRSAPTW